MTSHRFEFFDEDEHPTHKERHYRCDGELTTPNGLEIVSVTTALDVLSSPQLQIWAANVTAEAAWTLARKPGYSIPDDLVLRTGNTWDGWRRFLKEIKAHELDHESKRDEAARRGTATHDVHEDWVRYRKVPSTAGHPVSWHGYITAMARYIMDCEQAGEVPESVESVVGSAKYGFAGKCDLVSVTRDGKRIRKDFKTSRQVYARKHHRQLAGYELADVEMGSEPTDEQVVVILRPDGSWYADKSTATAKDFLNVLQVWRDDQPLMLLEDEEYKRRRAYEDAAKAKAKEEAV